MAESKLTHEEVIRVWTIASDAKQFKKVVNLAMYISYDCNRSFLRIVRVR